MTALIMPYARRRSSVAASGFPDFDRMFHNLFQNALTNMSSPSCGLGDFAVRMNVSERENAYVISADLPGVDGKDVELTVQDGVLTLKGERASESEEDGRTWHRVERSHGRFQRSLQLPDNADASGVKANMKNGVLEIEIAKTKAEEKSPQRIEIGRA